MFGIGKSKDETAPEIQTGETLVDGVDELERVGEQIADAASEEEVAAALDSLSDEEAIEVAGGLAPAGAMQMPMIAIPLEGVRVSVVPGPDGAKMLVLGPVVFELHAPLDSEGAKVIVKGLTGVEIATSLPPDLRGVR